MPDPERILQLIRNAAVACRDTRGRTGRRVELADAADVLVAGDLHGHLGHFQSILKIADLGKNPARHLVLQEAIHGRFQYPNGTDKSHQLLDLIASLKSQYPHRVHFLPGNHELAQATARPIARSAGELNSLFRAGIDCAYGARADAIYVAYLELIRAAPLGLRTANRVFISHSLPPADKLATWNPAMLTQEILPTEELQPGGSIYWLLWGRDLSAEAAAGFLAKVDADLLVTGHIPCEQGYLVPNERQIVLDSQDEPAGFVLFPANRPLTHAELVACVGIL